jgi:hypothetical protein
MTGVVRPVFAGGLTLIPGSTFGGLIVPFRLDNRLLISRSAGAIFSGGGAAALGGATGTVGLVGGAGWGFCAMVGAASRTSAVNESLCNMICALVLMYP